MPSYETCASPLGRLLLVAHAGALIGLYIAGQRHFPCPDSSWREDGNVSPIPRTRRALDRYFAGAPEPFGVPLAATGTAFQQAVWRRIAAVPFGETVTYGELARRSGCPRSVRAVAAATGRNPIGIIVPCHRIVAANGGLGGYAAGLDNKRTLLALEARCRRQTPAAP